MTESEWRETIKFVRYRHRLGHYEYRGMAIGAGIVFLPVELA